MLLLLRIELTKSNKYYCIAKIKSNKILNFPRIDRLSVNFYEEILIQINYFEFATLALPAIAFVLEA